MQIKQLYYCPDCDKYWFRKNYVNEIGYAKVNEKLDNFIKKNGYIEKTCRNCNLEKLGRGKYNKKQQMKKMIKRAIKG